MSYDKYDPTGKSLWGFKAYPITKHDLSVIGRVFASFGIDENNSIWDCDREGLRVEPRSVRETSATFNLMKLGRPRFFLGRQGLWLLNARGGWASIRHRAFQWDDDLAYYLSAVIKDNSGLRYGSAGDAIAAEKDGMW